MERVNPDDRERVGRIIADGLAQRRASFAAAIRSGRAADIQSSAQAFKSAAGSVGAHTLAAVLLAIEIAGQDGRVDDARSLAQGAQDQADAVLDYLQIRRAEHPSHE